MEELSIFEIVQDIVLWLNPVIFCIGIFLILAPKFYRSMEQRLNREIGGIKKVISPKLETNINSFQDWMLANNNLVGLLCIISSFVFFIVFRK